jgi:membrane protein implicated in regulation of membrane protease activity
MTLPAIIIMVIGIIAAIVGVNKQKQGATWGQPLAIIGAILAIGAAVWNFVGTLNGDQKGIQKNQRAQQLRGLYLAKEIAKASPKKVVIIDNASSHVDGYGDALTTPVVDHAIEGLKKGLGGATVDVIWQDVPKKPKPANPDEAPDPGMDIISLDAKALMAMLPNFEGADVVVFNALPDGPDSNIDIFKAIGMVAAKAKNVKFAILAPIDTETLGKMFGAKGSPLLAAVVFRADYDWESDMPSDDDKAFAQQFVLLTPADYKQGIEEANKKPAKKK